MLKCWEGNYNGNLRGLVTANSQRMAAEIVGTTVYGFVQYWHRRQLPTWPDFKPLTLYTKTFDSHDPWKEKTQCNHQED